MADMDEQQTLPPPPPTTERCYRHPDVETGVHCTRCGRPICPQCMIPAPVGHHCPECVAEARREFRAGPGRRAAVRSLSMTKLLLVAIFAMFILEIALGGAGSIAEGPSGRRLVDLGATVPILVAQGQYWRLITATFLHAGILHLALNAYALWLFGAVVERNFGKARFVAIYFVSGFLGSVASYTFSPITGEGLVTVGVGASGAIVGLLGAFVAYNFRRRHTILGRANLQWAVIIIAINAVIGQAFPGVDNKAHLGGLVAGFVVGGIADALGEDRSRAWMQWVLYAVMIAIGVALTAQHTAAIRDTFRLAGV
jgi:membrane associated rhomboid family serine protease